MQTEYYGLHSDGWVLPVKADPYTDLLQIAPADIPLLKAQRQALEERITEISTLVDGRRLTTHEVLTLNGAWPIAGDPEDCVVWDRRYTAPKWDDDEFLREVAEEGFNTPEQVRMIWACCLKIVAKRLAQRQVVNLIYFKLIPHPLHPHWPLYLVNEFGWRTLVEKDKAAEWLQKNLRIASKEKTSLPFVSFHCLATRELNKLTEQFETHEQLRPRYDLNLKEWIRRLALEIGEMWTEYDRKTVRARFKDDESPTTGLDSNSGLGNFNQNRLEAVEYVELIEKPAPILYDLAGAISGLDAQAKIVRELQHIQQGFEDVRDARRYVEESFNGQDDSAGLPLPDGSGLQCSR